MELLLLYLYKRVLLLVVFLRRILFRQTFMKRTHASVEQEQNKNHEHRRDAGGYANHLIPGCFL